MAGMVDRIPSTEKFEMTSPLVRTRPITICQHRMTQRKPGRWRAEFASIGTVHVLEQEGREGRVRMAAEAWVKCVGINRRVALAKLRAPDVILRGETDLDQVARRLTPTSLTRREAFLLTNAHTTYLLAFAPSPITMPRRGRARRSRRNPRHDRED